MKGVALVKFSTVHLWWKGPKLKSHKKYLVAEEYIV